MTCPRSRLPSPRSPNFNSIARPYALLEHLTFGSALHRTRTCFLPQLPPCRHALILGDGDGRFTAALLAAQPELEADAVDLSSAMLRLLTSRAHAAHPTASGRLRTRLADARTLTLDPQTRYDLVASHFFLDCLAPAELDHLAARLRPHLGPGATWLLSDFRIPPSGLLRPLARVLVRGLYLAFRLLTGLRTTQLPNHAAALTHLGFIRKARHLSLGGILTAELWQLPGSRPPSDPQSWSTLHRMQQPDTSKLRDPLPDPEPASPSLPEPDPGVFHHDPAPPAPTKPPLTP